MTGLPFEATRERFVRLEELLQLAAHMWDGDRAHSTGPATTSTPHQHPAPIRRPRVLIGGMGERRTLPLVARYADACNLFDIPDGGATLRHKLDVLARACEAIGRDPTRSRSRSAAASRPAKPPTSSSTAADTSPRRASTTSCSSRPAPGTGRDLDVVLDAARSLRRVSPTVGS